MSKLVLAVGLFLWDVSGETCIFLCPSFWTGMTESSAEVEFVPKFSRALRLLQSEEHEPLYRLLSISQDSKFITSAQAKLPGSPLVANLRCGAWYAPCFDATCYFKSTDTTGVGISAYPGLIIRSHYWRLLRACCVHSVLTTFFIGGEVDHVVIRKVDV